ncbi:MAG: four helix bundle protein [Planctomycetota bacterium]
MPQDTASSTAPPTTGSHRDLVAWQRAMDLVDAVYELTRGFPDDERFALTTQLRRAAVSAPSNIAEGYGRESPADYVRFLRIAAGSLREVETQIEIAVRQQMTTREEAIPAFRLCVETAKILKGLIRSKA